MRTSESRPLSVGFYLSGLSICFSLPLLSHATIDTASQHQAQEIEKIMSQSEVNEICMFATKTC